MSTIDDMRRLAQAAPAAEGDGEALPLAGAVCGGIRSHERRPAA